MSPVVADFVAEVGAERAITLTLDASNEAAALPHGHWILEATELYECHDAMLTKCTRTHAPAAHAR